MINEDFWQYQNAPDGLAGGGYGDLSFYYDDSSWRASPFINKWRL